MPIINDIKPEFGVYTKSNLTIPFSQNIRKVGHEGQGRKKTDNYKGDLSRGFSITK